MTCDITLPTSDYALPSEVTMDVTGKFQKLVDTALSKESIYMRAKDTFKELFDGKKINEAQYAELAANFVSQLATTTTTVAMQTAVAWAREERDGMYTLETLRAQAEHTMALREKVRADICLAEIQTELVCAQVTATLASSIRDNGRVATADLDNPCKPLTLEAEGTKYAQELAYNAQKYTSLADAYRKSGVVNIGTDSDGVEKGISADDGSCYTLAQTEFALRQVKSFEDSKRNHAANATSQMIGQMLSAEVPPITADVTRWRDAIDYLITDTP